MFIALLLKILHNILYYIIIRKFVLIYVVNPLWEQILHPDPDISEEKIEEIIQMCMCPNLGALVHSSEKPLNSATFVTKSFNYVSLFFGY